MRGRNSGWITNILVVILLQVLMSTNGENDSSSEETTKPRGKRGNLHSSYWRSTTPLLSSFPTFNTFTTSYKPVVYTYGPPATSSANAWASSTATTDAKQAVQRIHQEIQCGDAFPRACDDSRYRSYDGSCNNLYKPTWGMANTRYSRLLPANYGDGVKSPTISVTGAELPPSRLVSFTLFPSLDVDDPIWTLAAMQWGQIITHDMAMIDGSTQAKHHETQCCTDEGQLINAGTLHNLCYPIIVPYNDPVYRSSNIRCLNFVRSVTDLERGCTPQYKPAEQLTVVTHFMDLSLVYGNSEQTANSLRSGVAGRMTVDIRRNREWPPPATNKSGTCDTMQPEEVCYQTGDTRANQNPQLTILQIMLLREHNRIASYLARLNPHWTDETIFQETRRITIAEHQHISYYEWLPIFLGTRNTYANKILYNTKGYVNDYDPEINPSVINEHSSAAFRYFHSLIAGFLNLVIESRASSGALRLSDHFNRPGIIEQNNNMDDLTRGMSYQPEKASDQYFDREITEFLFRNMRPKGGDLRATDIQRNRDHGLASYNNFREYCGLPRAKTFNDFTDYISLDNVRKLSQLYASPDDVDLTVGGSLEAHVEGTLSGPTFLCILTAQFYRTRVGDRYWYERGDSKHSFTIEQLAEIKKASISRLFCDNGDDITRMQRRGFEQVSTRNPLTNCENIPSIDLSLWKDYAPEIANQEDSSFVFKK